ncbi:uncharacterized protein LOC132904163 [Amyelois transitella]|uniref:uncharacterized protein LOC132904163 n=1 Tax=Amyelois transitella TaxID=680683 RepID=UPI00298F971B|nr:uncharacterized protein LOC132904163 [Amyelois transitella]
MRCINCDVDIRRLRRHTTASLPNDLRAILTGWLSVERLHVIPLFIKKLLIDKCKLYIPRSTRVCETHLLLDSWNILMDNPNIYSYFTASQIEDMLTITKSANPTFNFENVMHMENVICHYWTGLTVANFLDLFNSLPPLSLRRPKHALAIYLAKLRTGETDRRLSSFFGVSRSTLIAILKKVRQSLTTHFVPNHIGTNHLTHSEIVDRNLRIPNALFGNENRPAIAIFDGTYIYVQKSSNYLYQKKTYSLHKYDNLVKPFMIVSCDGHIIDVLGPFAATQTDAEIMKHLFEEEDSPYRQLFHAGDVFILDRGFRDSISLLESLGYNIVKPESLGHGQRQLSTLQANKSRKVTLCRTIPSETGTVLLWGAHKEKWYL